MEADDTGVQNSSRTLIYRCALPFGTPAIQKAGPGAALFSLQPRRVGYPRWAPEGAVFAGAGHLELGTQGASLCPIIQIGPRTLPLFTQFLYEVAILYTNRLRGLFLSLSSITQKLARVCLFCHPLCQSADRTCVCALYKHRSRVCATV